MTLPRILLSRDLLALLLTLFIAGGSACGASDNAGDVDAGPNCEGLTTCSTAGTSCSGDALLTCATDANGCLVETTLDCTESGQSCDGSASPAACAASCDDPSCLGLSEGEGFCSGSIPVTCSADSAGCLLEHPAQSCEAEVCDDSTAPPTCQANGTGESCAALFTVQDDITVSGEDLLADFGHNETFDGASCPVTVESGASPEAVFAVELLAGQTVHLSEHGGVDAVLGIVPSCDGAAECLASEGGFGAEIRGITYTANEDEVVFAFVSAFEDFSGNGPFVTDYDIRFTITQCGDRVTEGPEGCDDNDQEGDGCTACRVDLGYECDNSSVSVCTGPTDLGTYAAGDPIPDTVETVSLEADETHFYRVTFTDDVLLEGTLDAAGGEDIDIGFFDLDENLVFSSESVGGESFSNEVLPAGTYTILLLAFEAVPNGWTLTLATEAGPVCGDGLLGIGEACDDDNDVPQDGCTACQVDPGFLCDNSSAPSVCASSCGNGLIDPGDECDDGNAGDDDRCSNNCELNADVIDAEDNNSFANAQILADGEIARGSLSPADGDSFDLYTFTLASPSWVTMESYTTVDGTTDNYDGAGLDNRLDCGADPDLRLFDDSGDPLDNNTALLSDDASGDNFCGYLGPNTSGGAAFLDPGTYYIKVNEFFGGAIAQYALDLQIDAPLTASASCDVAFDLCDPTTLSCSSATDTCQVPATDRGVFELFAADFDLSNTRLELAPNGATFGFVSVPASGFDDLPGSGSVSSTSLTLTDDGSSEHSFSFAFPFFGQNQSSVFVNANGNLTFGAGDADPSESVVDHFALPRISFFFDDLFPNTAGTVTVDEFANRLTITFDGVVGSDGAVSAQVQLFASGHVDITYLAVGESDGLVGISAGDNAGIAPAESDFSSVVPRAPVVGDLVINEVMVNPNLVSDTNCDGAFDSTDDEFIEIVNVSGVTLDLSGVTLDDLFTTRHSFAGPVFLGDREVVVVYGGGSPSCPGVFGVVSSSGLLGFNNGGDALTLANAQSDVLDTMSYDTSTVGISSTRSPDLAGAFVDHDEAPFAVGPFSPGTRVSGDTF